MRIHPLCHLLIWLFSLLSCPLLSSAIVSSASMTQPDGVGSFLEAEGMERTYKFTQEDIVKHVDVSAAKKVRVYPHVNIIRTVSSC